MSVKPNFSTSGAKLFLVENSKLTVSVLVAKKKMHNVGQEK